MFFRGAAYLRDAVAKIRLSENNTKKKSIFFIYFFPSLREQRPLVVEREQLKERMELLKKELKHTKRLMKKKSS